MTSSDRPAGHKPEGELKQPGLPEIDVNEYGGKKDGVRQSMNRRLFMQLLVFETYRSSGPSIRLIGSKIGEDLRGLRIPGVVYADLTHPRRVGLLTWSEDPAHFVNKVFDMIHAFGELRIAKVRQEMTMLGRTYSTGHEPDLGFVLLERPVNNVMNPAYPWHIWYPLRRTGSFAKLPPEEQGSILREHASIGMAYGQKELAHDIRLACHGIDTNDNEFVIGLVGPELHPLSHLVQTMRKTRQTSEYIAKMGPFFVGHVLERSSGS